MDDIVVFMILNLILGAFFGWRFKVLFKKQGINVIIRRVILSIIFISFSIIVIGFSFANDWIILAFIFLFGFLVMLFAHIFIIKLKESTKFRIGTILTFSLCCGLVLCIKNWIAILSVILALCVSLPEDTNQLLLVVNYRNTGCFVMEDVTKKIYLNGRVTKVDNWSQDTNEVEMTSNLSQETLNNIYRAGVLCKIFGHLEDVPYTHEAYGNSSGGLKICIDGKLIPVYKYINGSYSYRGIWGKYIKAVYDRGA